MLTTLVLNPCCPTTVTEGKNFQLSGFYEIFCIKLDKRLRKNFKSLENSVTVFEKGDIQGTKNYYFLIILKNTKFTKHKIQKLRSI